MRNLRPGYTAALTAALIVIMVAPPAAQTPPPAARSSNAVAAIPAERVDLLVGRSTVLRVDRPIKRVSLPKPEVADALVTSPHEVLVHGKAPGTISLFVWGDNGDIRTFDVIVRRDLSELEQRVRQLFPGEAIQVSSNGDDVVLSGTVSSKYAVDKAAALAAGYVEKVENVVNLLRQQEGVASNQILLRVRFAEVSRSALQELGVSFFTSPTGIENTLGRVTTQQFSAPGYDNLKYSKESSDFGAPVTSASGEFTFSDFLNLFFFSERYDIGAMVRALSSKGLFQSLAEPNLVTQNGKEASFLAGGEFPYPVVQGTAGSTAVTIEFKEFGIRLKFTPTVIGNELIHLKVAPEVSALDFGNAVTMNGFRIPALTTRRTETEVELRDGQTFAIAGLMDNSLTSTMSKVPGIGDIPILGYLFRSRAYQKNSTELVVMITPQILRRDSTGVTSKLPDLVQPYLGPEPRTYSVPPPAFTTPRPTDLIPQGSTPGRVSDHRSPTPPVAGAPEAPVAAAVPTPPPAQATVPPRVTAPPQTVTPQTVTPPVVAKVDTKADERARREEEQRQRDEQKRMREEEKRAKEAAEIDAKRQAEMLEKQHEELKKRQAEEKKQQEELQKKLTEQQKKLAEQQRKAAELQKKGERQPEGEPQATVVMPEQPVPVDPPSAEEAANRIKRLEEQRAEAERKKIEERKKAQQKAAKRRALSDPYPPLRSRRSW